jgi:hypothetical protein
MSLDRYESFRPADYGPQPASILSGKFLSSQVRFGETHAIGSGAEDHGSGGDLGQVSHKSQPPASRPVEATYVTRIDKYKTESSLFRLGHQNITPAKRTVHYTGVVHLSHLSGLGFDHVPSVGLSQMGITLGKRQQ